MTFTRSTCAALLLALATALPALAGPAIAPEWSPTDGTPPPVGLPGTLDPVTGVFTPATATTDGAAAAARVTFKEVEITFIVDVKLTLASADFVRGDTRTVNFYFSASGTGKVITNPAHTTSVDSSGVVVAQKLTERAGKDEPATTQQVTTFRITVPARFRVPSTGTVLNPRLYLQVNSPDNISHGVTVRLPSAPATSTTYKKTIAVSL